MQPSRWQPRFGDPPLPPRPDCPRASLLYPRNGATAVGVALEDAYHSAFCHWDDGRTRLCTGEANGCPYCLESKWAPRWYAFLAVTAYPLCKPAVMVLTEGAVAYCDAIQQAQGELRGTWWKCFRWRSGNRTGVRLQRQAPPVVNFPLAPPFSAWQVMLRFWGIDLPPAPPPAQREPGDE